jgi:LPS O-antigen subunit length determinant protein (WzzB/FepE family)
MEWCKAPRRLAEQPVASTDATEFRFKFGRFAGMTLAEADAKPNGRKYLEYMATTNDKLRERIAEYLKQGSQRVSQDARGEAAGTQ